jgi:hypothetical protein
MPGVQAIPTATEPARPAPINALTSQQALSLLKISLAGERRPIDDLIDWLRRENDASWLERAITGSGLASAAQLAALLDGRTGIEEIIAVKEASKSHLAEAQTSEHALGALAAYALSVASALVHHGRVISTRSRSEWSNVFTDLGEVLPEPWSQLFIRAAQAPSSIQSPPKSNHSPPGSPPRA